MVAWGQARGITDPVELREAFERAREEHRAANPSRRAFLGGGAASLASLALPGTFLAACGKDPVTNPPDKTDVIAIIGGGMAGIHCAYRLKEKGIKATVYEAQNRVGGRMFTARDKFLDGQVCELGGELIDTQHLTLHALAPELGLTLDDRFANEPMGYAQDTWWINGTMVPDATLVQQMTAAAPAFQAAANEMDPAKIQALDETDLNTWLIENVPPAMYPELHGILQAAYRGEYGLENSEQSSFNLTYFIDSETTDPFHIFGDSDERYHTHTGNEDFPTLLAKKLDADQIQLNTSLIAARDVAAGGYEIDLQTASGVVTKQVTRIVFALPFTVLRKVDLTKLKLTDLKSKIINELGYGTNAKVMAGFKERTWRTKHNASGSLTCDMPVQQTWETSIGQDGASGILTNFLGGDQGVKSGTGTEDAWVKGILPNLESVWPGLTSQYTGTAVRMHWPTVPTHLGSYACYKPGQWAFSGHEGERVGNLHFCGEHTSVDFQGYMEGAAETGALVAAEILDDHGIAHGQGLINVLGPKLEIAHPCYRASELEEMTFPERRRMLREAIQKAYEKVDSAG